jgi:hypothetical protein
MKGERTGLKTRILDVNPKAMYIHCYGHSLNLAVQDTVKSIKMIKDIIDVSYEITKLVKFSPKREALLDTIKKEVRSSTGGIRTLCPTRYNR